MDGAEVVNMLDKNASTLAQRFIGLVTQQRIELDQAPTGPVQSADFLFQAGVDVTDVAQVKGLEFDYVILVDVNQSAYPETTEARHLLHIGATRATHQLWLISTERPSPLVAYLAEESEAEGARTVERALQEARQEREET